MRSKHFTMINSMTGCRVSIFILKKRLFLSIMILLPDFYQLADQDCHFFYKSNFYLFSVLLMSKKLDWKKNEILPDDHNNGWNSANQQSFAVHTITLVR